MTGPKKAAKKKPSAKRSTAPKKAAKRASLQKRAARDPYLGPTTRQIEESLNKGTKQSLTYFRGMIDWS